VAAQLFWTKGYAATTTRELADALGVQKASLYHYMDSKEDLLYSICLHSVQNLYDRVIAAVGRAHDPLARVRAVIGAHVMAMLEDREKHATMLTELESLSPTRRDEVSAKRSEYEKLVREVLVAAQEAGALTKDLAAKDLELTLLNLLNWTIFWYRPEGEYTPEDLVEMFERLYLGGAAARRPQSSKKGISRRPGGGGTRPPGCG